MQKKPYLLDSIDEKKVAKMDGNEVAEIDDKKVTKML
jgi:hypothetical protein